MELDTNYEYEIKRRNEIHIKACKGMKLSKEERDWCETHRAFNHKFGYPYLNKDIIKFIPGKTFNVIVTMISKNYKSYINPIFSVVGKSGYIIYGDKEVVDNRGNKSIGKKIRSLCICDNEDNFITDFTFCSKVGFMAVDYMVSFYDEKVGLYKTITSNTGLANVCMIREDILENEIIYKCKNPINDNFDAMIFSVKWKCLDE